MQFDEFVGKVQHRAKMPSSMEAVNAIRATLMTLGERLAGGESGDLAAQLPKEIGTYLLYPDKTESYTLKEFLERVAELEDIDYPDAVYHARAVIETVDEAVSEGQIDHVLDQLPEEFDTLFTSGTEGSLNMPG